MKTEITIHNLVTEITMHNLARSQLYAMASLYSIIRTSTPYDLYSNIDEIKEVIKIQIGTVEKLRRNKSKSIIKICR